MGLLLLPHVKTPLATSRINAYRSAKPQAAVVWKLDDYPAAINSFTRFANAAGSLIVEPSAIIAWSSRSFA